MTDTFRATRKQIADTAHNLSEYKLSLCYYSGVVGSWLAARHQSLCKYYGVISSWFAVQEEINVYEWTIPSTAVIASQ